MKKIVIVTPFDNYSYNVRVKYIEKFFLGLGYEVTILSSNFDHRNKKKYINSREGLELIEVREYKKNLSISRIISHYQFAKKSVKRVNEINPDIAYVSGPPNLLFRSFSLNKKYNSNIKLIYEIGDMWPETMPISESKKKICTPLFSIWSSIRDKYLPKGDYIIFECDMFKRLVQNKSKEFNGRTVYMCKESMPFVYDEIKLSDNEIDLIYLGSINNIIDIDLIVRIIDAINKRRKVIFHIIGEGENKSELISKVERIGAEVINHGIVYDDVEKRKIFNGCHYALNIMKDSVCVGMTMKSIDYFEAGMPLINNIKHDTHDLVEKTGCGYNIEKSNIDEIVNAIMLASENDVKKMKIASRKIFDEKFSVKVFNEIFNDVIKKL